jgi:hypothetical protein
MLRPFTPKKAALGLGVAGALALGIAVPTMALADNPTPSPSTAAPSGPGKWGAERPDRDKVRADRQAALAEALAKELGLPQDKVAAALQKVEQQMADQAKTERLGRLKTRLDQAVNEGKLTREQADAILKAVEAGVMPGGMGHRRGPGW